MKFVAYLVSYYLILLIPATRYYNIMGFSISIAACLGLHSVPESGWHCLNCEDNTGDERGARPIMIRLTRVDKEPEYEVGGCVVCR